MLLSSKRIMANIVLILPNAIPIGATMESVAILQVYAAFIMRIAGMSMAGG